MEAVENNMNNSKKIKTIKAIEAYSNYIHRYDKEIREVRENIKKEEKYLDLLYKDMLKYIEAFKKLRK